MSSSDVERLKTAFALFVARKIVDADDVVDFGELKLLSKVFPDERLREYGFLDASGDLTAVFQEAWREAARVLPDELQLDEKLELLEVLHKASLADGEVVQAELLIVREAAEILRVPLHTLSDHLQRLKSATPVPR